MPTLSAVVTEKFRVRLNPRSGAGDVRFRERIDATQALDERLP
jgi:hypothetical protein